MFARIRITLICIISGRLLSVDAQWGNPSNYHDDKNFKAEVYAKLRWVDHVEREYSYEEQNVHMDRIGIFLVNNPHSHQDKVISPYTIIAPAVLFDNGARILTSYNPFRSSMAYKAMNQFGNESNPFVIFLRQRKIHSDGRVEYTFYQRYMICGREVHPRVDNINPWHAFGGKMNNNPLHDLMVFRTFPITTLDDNGKYNFDTRDKYVEAGAFTSKLAKPGDYLGRAVMFVSLGFRNKQEMVDFNEFYATYFDEEDNVVENCEEWLPRDWGHFICVRNVKGYEGLGSGAVLFHDWKVYGIGSFLLHKGKKGVFVFTDVRKYYDLIMTACTEEYQISQLITCQPEYFHRQPTTYPKPKG